MNADDAKSFRRPAIFLQLSRPRGHDDSARYQRRNPKRS
jgi:hypothetical protein